MGTIITTTDYTGLEVGMLVNVGGEQLVITKVKRRNTIFLRSAGVLGWLIWKYEIITHPIRVVARWVREKYIRSLYRGVVRP
jgi:hypothetical protein